MRALFPLVALVIALLFRTLAVPATAAPGDRYLHFLARNRAYIEVADHEVFSVAGKPGFTVSVWLRPDALAFETPHPERYVNWLGKGVGSGTTGQQEWTFRWVEPDRIAFYVFNLSGRSIEGRCGGPGCGSYFRGLKPRVFNHIVGVADGRETHIYHEGIHRDSDRYDDIITPRNGTAPLRIGTRDFATFLTGGVAQVRIWNRALSLDEVEQLNRLERNGEALTAQLRDALVAEYLLNEGFGSTAHDTVGGRHGRIRQATWQAAPAPAPQIRITTPRSGEQVGSPLYVAGRVRPLRPGERVYLFIRDPTGSWWLQHPATVRNGAWNVRYACVGEARDGKKAFTFRAVITSREIPCGRIAGEPPAGPSAGVTATRNSRWRACPDCRHVPHE